ncbi:hypothetical protein [Stenotrophomonas sp. RG-453]|uniref:hypothetical protein n=1 Tax=Stenotrophomonas sp. RG-453 TaxID=2957502 RepID=UPI0029CA6615|nr:hypothetical protein [Stenotrophomonas sp. RG-453]MDX5516190.1 hypothetical protein [Stenotrophomonas sp. RG-453]
MEPGIKNCVVWWDAWAAVGAWAAAIATFFAVIVPVFLSSRKERLRNELELSDFVYSLPPFIAQWRRSLAILEQMSEEPSENHVEQLDALRLALSFPSLEPAFRMRRVLIGFRTVSRDLAAWNRTVEEFRNRLSFVNFDEPWEVDGATQSTRLGVAMLNEFSLNISGHLRFLLDAISTAAPSVEPEIRAIRGHLGFGVYS